MKRKIIFFLLMLAIGFAYAALAFIGTSILPKENRNTVFCCCLVQLFTISLAIAACLKPVMTQFIVSVGFAWGFIFGLLSLPYLLMESRRVYWPSVLIVSIVLPLVIFLLSLLVSKISKRVHSIHENGFSEKFKSYFTVPKVILYILLIVTISAFIMHIQMNTDLVEERKHEFAMKSQYLPPGCDVNADVLTHVTRGHMPTKESVKKYDIANKCSPVYRSVMKAYQVEIPIMLVKKPFDIDKATFHDLLYRPIPKFNQCRKVARAIAAYGDYQFLTGSPEDAAETYFQLYRMGVDLGYGHGLGATLIDAMISLNIKCLALKKMCHIFGLRLMPVEFEKEILGKITRCNKKDNTFESGLKAEKMFLMKMDVLKDYARSLFNFDTDDESKRKTRGFFERIQIYLCGKNATTIKDVFIKKVFDLHRKVLKAGSYKDSEKDRNKIILLKKKLGQIHWYNSWPSEVLARDVISLNLTNYLGAIKKELSFQNVIRGLEIIHQINLFYDKNGQYPEKLDDLGAKLPNDLFSGKEFMYKREGDYFRLYGTGENLNDDGGNYKKKSSYQYEDQIIFSEKREVF